MITKLGKEGLVYSHQADFPEETSCTKCKTTAKIAFVAMEQSEEKYVSSLAENMDSLWPHDAIAVAVYFCPKCLNCEVLWNQA